jgi:hypothetical protein
MDEINIDGCSRHSEKGRQHGCEYDSIIVPESICSEYKMAFRASG